MSKLFAWVLFLSSAAAFGITFRSQQIMAAWERDSVYLAEPLPPSYAALDDSDALEP